MTSDEPIDFIQTDMPKEKGDKTHVIMETTGFVMGVSVHATRHRNSTYVQTVRRSIYDNRRTKHPHSQISW